SPASSKGCARFAPRPAFTRPPAAKCSARSRRRRRANARRFTRAAPMAWPRCTATTSRSITARATTSTPARASSSTTKGRGLDWQKYVVVDPKFYRPAEVDLLLANPAKSNRVLGWHPQLTFTELVQMMVDADVALLCGQKSKYWPKLLARDAA